MKALFWQDKESAEERGRGKKRRGRVRGRRGGRDEKLKGEIPQ